MLFDEYHQPSGGIFNFLMVDRDAETFYEVEIMLGALDESHIIRTIEYWDMSGSGILHMSIGR